MIIDLIRFQEDSKHTKSILKIDGITKCFILEDAYHKEKIYGKTRIPSGTYKIELRNEGQKNKHYSKKYGKEFHKGMLWLRNVPNFEYIYIHIGNTPKETLGCLLTGFICDITKQQISNSRLAYEAIYPIIRDAILKEDVYINVL